MHLSSLTMQSISVDPNREDLEDGPFRLNPSPFSTLLALHAQSLCVRILSTLSSHVHQHLFPSIPIIMHVGSHVALIISPLSFYVMIHTCPCR